MTTQLPTGIFDFQGRSGLSASSFQPDGGKEWFFTILEVTEEGGNRLARHRRLHRRGARLDGSGPKERTWTIKSEFHNANFEADELDIARMYPEQLNSLIKSFEDQVTGTLWLSTRGPVRARCETYRRIEIHSARDCAVIEMLFVEDNEDDSWSESFTAPPATAASEAEAFGESIDELASSGADLVASVEELASGIEQAIQAPGEFIDQIEGTANALRSSAERVQEALTGEAEKLWGDPLDGATADDSSPSDATVEERRRMAASPARAEASARLYGLKEVAARAKATASRSVQRELPIVRNVDVSLFDIAASEGVSVADLLKVNSGVSPFLVPAGKAIVMPARKFRQQ